MNDTRAWPQIPAGYSQLPFCEAIEKADMSWTKNGWEPVDERLVGCDNDFARNPGYFFIRSYGAGSLEMNQNINFEKAAEPLMKYLAENHNPHCTAIVTNSRAELVEGLMAFSSSKFVKD